MGHHHQYSRQIIEDLAARLNKYQVGAPATEEMFAILSILFKEEEAHVGSQFPIGPTTLRSLSRKTGRTPESLEPILESMAQKGLVMDQMVRGRRLYLLTPTIFGFFEFTLMRVDRDLPYKRLAELMERLFEKAMAEEFFGSRTPMSRTLVQEKVLSGISSTVMPYENVSELIRSSSSLSIQDCFCRRKVSLLGQKCKIDAPIEGTCMAIGSSSDFLVRRGFARAATQDELLLVLDEAEKCGLVHITDNVRDDPRFICNCCGCCCELLQGITRCNYEGAINPSRFQVELNEERCSGCGECLKSCQVEVISLPEKKASPQKVTFDISRCLGCGLCISRCARKALVLTERPILPRISKNYLTRHLAITHQKGRLHHSLGYMAGMLFGGEFLDFFAPLDKR